MLVVPRADDATLVCPRLEAPRVVERPDVFRSRPWDETDDPLDSSPRWSADGHGRRRRPHLGALRRRPPAPLPGHHVASSASRSPARCGPSRTPPRSTPCAGPAPPPTGWPPSSRRARSRWWAAPRPRCRPTSAGGCSPRATTGSTSPSSPPGRTPPAPTTSRATRVIAPRRGRAVRLRRHDAHRRRRRLLLGHHPLRVDRRAAPAEVAEVYAVLHEAQAAAVAAAIVGTPCEDVDAAARRDHRRRRLRRRSSSTAPATASASRSTRTPTSSAGNAHAAGARPRLLVEPGIYLPGRLGFRLEDIVVAADGGPDALNRADHALVVVDA